MSRTIPVYVHYKSLDISLSFPEKQREMFDYALYEEREVRGLVFKILFQIYRGAPDSVL